MARVTKSRIESIARDYAEKKYKAALDKAKLARRVYAQENLKVQLSKLPKMSKELIDAGFIKMDTRVNFWYSNDTSQNSWCRREYITVDPFTQVIIRNELEVPYSKTGEKLHKKITELESARTKLRDEVEDLMLQLKTDKRIVENLPELKEFFPSSGPGGDMIPVSKIKEVKKLMMVKVKS